LGKLPLFISNIDAKNQAENAAEPGNFSKLVEAGNFSLVDMSLSEVSIFGFFHLRRDWVGAIFLLDKNGRFFYLYPYMRI
jgi:hypothetical protein